MSDNEEAIIAWDAANPIPPDCDNGCRCTAPAPPPPQCGCSWRWGSYGELYGADMGEGWLMAERAADCPVVANHGRGWGRPMVVR